MKKKRTVVILLFNTKKQLLLQQLSSLDKEYPEYWNFSAGGRVQKDEEPETAAKRELRGELGVDSSLRYIDTRRYSDSSVENEYHFYQTVYDGAFDFDIQKITDIQFFSLQKIDRMINRGEKFVPEFSYFWDKKFIQYLDI